MKIKDVFGYGNITLTGTNGGIVTLNPNDILCLAQEEEYTVVTVAKAGFCFNIMVKQTPGRIKQKANNLAAKQEKIHQQMEEEARAKAQESFFEKYPKTKATFQEESTELNKQ